MACSKEALAVSFFAVTITVTRMAPSQGSHKPEKLLKLAARIVSTTLRSPLRSAYSKIKTAARRLTGSVSQSGNAGGL